MDELKDSIYSSLLQLNAAAVELNEDVASIEYGFDVAEIRLLILSKLTGLTDSAKKQLILKHLDSLATEGLIVTFDCKDTSNGRAYRALTPVEIVAWKKKAALG